MKRVRMQVQFTEQLIRALKADASLRGISPSEVLRQAYAEWSVAHAGEIDPDAWKREQEDEQK